MLQITTKEFILGVPFKAKKKPIEIDVIQPDVDFVVKTKEGNMVGQAGDYCIRGVEGELYPCAKAIFEATYEKI